MTWLGWLGVGYLALLALILRVVHVAEREEKRMRCSFNVLHVVPSGDVIEHTVGGGDCVCGPTVKPVRRDGGWQWVATHHPLMPATEDA